MKLVPRLKFFSSSATILLRHRTFTFSLHLVFAPEVCSLKFNTEETRDVKFNKN